MIQSKEDLINKIETLIGFIEDGNLTTPIKNEAQEWVEEIRNNELVITD